MIDFWPFFMATCRVVSIDPGIRNFALYTEDINIEKLRELKAQTSQKKKKSTSPPEDRLSSLYLTGSSCGECIGVHCLLDCTHKIEKGLTNEVRISLYNLLEKYKEQGFWEGVNHVIIEEQFINTRPSRKGGGTANMNLIKIAEATYTWILSNFPTISTSYIPSKFKYTFNLCPRTVEKKSRKTGKMEPRKMVGYDRKKWGIERGKHILELREEGEILKNLLEIKQKKSQKLDDICDCIIQLQAFKWTTEL